MLAGFGQGDLGILIGNVAVLDHDFELIDLNVTGIVIIGHFHVHVLAEAAQHGHPHGLFQGVDEHVAVKALVLADLVNGLLEFKIHVCLRLPRGRGRLGWDGGPAPCRA